MDPHLGSFHTLLRWKWGIISVAFNSFATATALQIWKQTQIWWWYIPQAKLWQFNEKLPIKIVVSYPRKNILSKAYSTLILWKEEIWAHTVDRCWLSPPFASMSMKPLDPAKHTGKKREALNNNAKEYRLNLVSNTGSHKLISWCLSSLFLG